jgi:hypothetical protein
MSKEVVTMKKFKVKTPVETFNGERLGCKFENGEHICTCGDMKKLKEFESWGYLVEEIVEEKPKKAPKKTEK